MGKISKEEKKRYQIVSRILGVLMRIANVCCWIGTGCVLLVAIAASIIAPSVKIDAENKEISLFGNTASYTIDGQEFDYGDEDGRITIKDNTVTITDKDAEVISVKLSEDSLKELEAFVEKDAPKILAVLPFVLVMTVVLLGVYALALGHGASVLKNIAKEDTPFIKDNIERIEKTFKYLLVGFILTFAINFTTAVASGFRTNIGGETVTITSVLGVYVLVYIFKAGYQLSDVKVEKEDKK